jgi:signal transduction histidine kinase/ActR/RegA family two-component response regulator
MQRVWQRTSAEAATAGRMVSGGAASALALGDRTAAGQVLASLRADELIRDAALYDARGACFAAFHRSGSGGCPPPAPDGVRRGRDQLAVGLPVLADGRRLGTLVLIARPLAASSALFEYLSFALWMVALSLAVATVTAIVIQSHFANPILAIAKVAQRMAETHRFEERVEVSCSRELAVLARSFNTMLEEIARRDVGRAEDRRSLELQIAECSRVNAELRFAIEKAEEASRLKGQFLANMSHEIRTPMNGILGFTQLALATGLTEDQRDYMDTVEKSAEALMQLINDILDVSKIEAGRVELDRAPFAIRDCVDGANRTMSASAQRKGLALSWDVDPRIPDTLVGDESRIRQVLLNLVGNAIKFTDAGFVRVAVEMEPAPDGSLIAHFSVRDSGPGIAREKQKIIFEAFRQADGSTTRKYGGSGLGLAISTGLVDLMGGRIWVESQPGQGSTFHFTSPFRLAAAPLPLPSTPAGNGTECAPLSILVAEDNVVSQKLVGALLRERRHTVTIAANGGAVLSLVEQQPFDLILMDIQMPEMDGLQATAEIRRREGRTGNRIPIVAMTAHAMAGDRERCLEAGMDGYIAKPIHPGELMALITGISAQRIAVVSA